jgi:addiction module HigA family antidote
MKKIRVAHPGEILLKEFIAANDLTVYRVAKDSGIPQPSLQLITSGRRSITAETALRLGLYFGIDAQFWLNLQGEYDLRVAREEKLNRIEKEVHPLSLQAA